jgi:spermidine synthase
MGAASGISAIFAIAVTMQLADMVGESVVSTRNFYGTLRVVDEGSGEDRARSLIDGVIDHGSQFLSPPRDHWVTTYYGENAGIAMAMQAIRTRGPLKIGVIGLGAGTLAWYGRRGDRFDIVEINPDVVDIAKKQFSFISNSEAETQIILGDGRLAFERLSHGSYDLIAVDAFSSDSIPVHLLTKEAFGLYFDKLKSNGVLCVNVSNRFLDLAPVVMGASLSLGREAWVIKDSGDLGKGLTGSTWVVVVNPKDSKELEAIRRTGKANGSVPRVWTDDHSSLMGLLRY